MRLVVVQSLLDQAILSRQWQKCVSFAQERSELELHISMLRRESTVVGKRIDFHRTLAAAQQRRDWSECARLSEELKLLDEDMSCPDFDDAQMSSGLHDDSVVLRIAILQQEQNAAAKSKMFVRCQTLQQEIDILRRESEISMLRVRARSRYGLSDQAPSIQQGLLELKDSRPRASAANEHEENHCIESEMTSVASHLEKTRPNVSSLEGCMVTCPEPSQLSSTLTPTPVKPDLSLAFGIQQKRVVLQQTLIKLETLQQRAKDAQDYTECVRVGQQIKETQDSISALCSSNARMPDAAEPVGFAQGHESKVGLQMSIQALLESHGRLPPRVSIFAVRIGAVGKVTSDVGGLGVPAKWCKGGGKCGQSVGKAVINAMCKGKSKGSMNKVVLHVFDEASCHTITLHWKKATLSVAGLEKALASISNATPVISDSGQLHLELDHRSDVKTLLNPRNCTLDLYKPIASNLSLTISQASCETIGCYFDIVLRCHRVTLKAKSDLSGGQFLQIGWVDLEGHMMQMPVFDYDENDFQEGHYYIAWGLVLRPGRSRLAGGLWVDDYNWGQLRYSGWSTAFVNVFVLTILNNVVI
jgi:hypothetical protein